MRARLVALLLGIAASVAVVPVDAAADRPVFVVVVGQGDIRLRLATGGIAPCDSADNRMLFDGWVGVGTHRWETGADLVCYQYTSGALRESNWSTAQVIPTVRPRKGGPMEIRISTD